MKASKLMVTHGGKFHADDVFSAALMKKLWNSKGFTAQFKRVFKVTNAEADADIVFDIGGGRFDHHDPDKKQFRENGVQYAAFGLLWREFGKEFYPNNPELIEEFDSMFVQAIDLADNGVERNLLSTAIAYMNPGWDSTQNSDQAFENAVEVAESILDSWFESMNSRLRGEKIIKDAIEKCDTDRILILEQFAPWESIVVPDGRFDLLIFPSNRGGGWNIRTVPTEIGGLVPRVPLPETWIDKNSKKPEGMTFCHPNRFLAAFENLKQAIDAAIETLNQ